MNVIEKAISIALKAHMGQVDKAGKPYILHPLRLMGFFDDDISMIAALLHDVLEDSDYSADDLVKSGIPEEAVEIVKTLTITEGESYEEFIKRISGNQKAASVKIKDIEDNMDIKRLNSIDSAAFQRLVKYHKALQCLRGSVS